MKTALEELIEALENNADGRYFLEQYWVKDLLTKEQEQRAELIKAVAVECYKASLPTARNAYEKNQDNLEAELYYNEVIKPKYEI